MASERTEPPNLSVSKEVGLQLAHSPWAADISIVFGGLRRRMPPDTFELAQYLTNRPSAVSYLGPLATMRINFQVSDAGEENQALVESFARGTASFYWLDPDEAVTAAGILLVRPNLLLHVVKGEELVLEESQIDDRSKPDTDYDNS